MAILEGKELEGKLGDLGAYSLDIDEKFMLSADISIKIDLYAELEKVVNKSSSDLLKKAMHALGGFLGRAEQVAAVQP